MSLKLMLEKAVAEYGEKPAVISSDGRLSFTDLDEKSNRFAHALVKIGVEKGDRVAMMLSNSLEFIITYFGIVKAGALAVPLDTQYKVKELVSIFDNCQPTVLIAENATLDRLSFDLAEFKTVKHIIDVGSEESGKFLSYRDILAASPSGNINIELKPEDLVHIAYVSGPSFNPTGALFPHQSLLEEAIMSAEGFEQTDRDIVMLFALPMYHMFGLAAVLLTSIYCGSTLVIVPGTGLSIQNFFDAVEREKGTMFFGVPYIFALAVEMAEKNGIDSNLDCLRLCASAGAPLPINVIKRFKQYFGYSIIDFWGLSEAVCHVTCLPANGKGKLGSVGKVLSGWQMKIVGDNGLELPPGKDGEIIVSGPIMEEYYRNPQATAEVIKDGWLYTGDIGRVSEDGYLFITGRKKDAIIMKGQNIYPGDIEITLSSHPKVAEVAVLGIPDVMRGEVVGAVIRLKEGEKTTEQEMKQFCLEQIASYKVPRQIIFVESFPKTPAGGIDKEAVRVNLSIPPLFPVK